MTSGLNKSWIFIRDDTYMTSITIRSGDHVRFTFDEDDPDGPIHIDIIQQKAMSRSEIRKLRRATKALAVPADRSLWGKIPNYGAS